jgi:hypothetical protein
MEQEAGAMLPDNHGLTILPFFRSQYTSVGRIFFFKKKPQEIGLLTVGPAFKVCWLRCLLRRIRVKHACGEGFQARVCSFEFVAYDVGICGGECGIRWDGYGLWGMYNLAVASLCGIAILEIVGMTILVCGIARRYNVGACVGSRSWNLWG